jgi:hypothetical protein
VAGSRVEDFDLATVLTVECLSRTDTLCSVSLHILTFNGLRLGLRSNSVVDGCRLQIADSSC